MTEKNLMEAFIIYNQVCIEINNENESKGIYRDVSFEVLQLSEFYNDPNFVLIIADFYDSYRKNKDFIHIPDMKTVLENSRKYPIIIARNRKNGKLLGISTVKYFENNDENINPYFPMENRKFFEVSGLMACEDNIYYGIPGIGKHIFEIIVLGASVYSRKHSDVGLMGVIDSRNVLSVNAVKSGLRMIRENNRFGSGYEISGNIAGYYEVRDFDTGDLTEAQTLVVELDLTPSLRVDVPEVVLEFSARGDEVTSVIERELRRSYSGTGIELKSVIPDYECGNVIFYEINRSLSSRVEGVTIIPHESALGNDRVSSKKVVARKMVC